MRNRNSNELNNIWKKIINEQKKIMDDKLKQNVATQALSGKVIRDDFLEFGAIQLTKTVNLNVTRMGQPGGTVG